MSLSGPSRGQINPQRAGEAVWSRMPKVVSFYKEMRDVRLTIAVAYDSLHNSNMSCRIQSFLLSLMELWYSK